VFNIGKYMPDYSSDAEIQWLALTIYITASQSGVEVDSLLKAIVFSGLLYAALSLVGHR